ncbi:hypothetical protein [Synechocystis sp. PCC 7509]|uniref:hypothetical protein n=1 Tax=Synechocystis sp. PCC 7509 TaxID=927677 RepID=UPI00130E6C7E|nr:hypothetical protein [Synechocystis sp. PCC 7509]
MSVTYYHYSRALTAPLTLANGSNPHTISIRETGHITRQPKIQPYASPAKSPSQMSEQDFIMSSPPPLAWVTTDRTQLM